MFLLTAFVFSCFCSFVLPWIPFPVFFLKSFLRGSQAQETSHAQEERKNNKRPKSSKADFIPRFLSRLYAANRATMRFSRGARLKKSNPSIVILSFLVSLFSLIFCVLPDRHTRREAKNTRLAFWICPQTC